MRHYTQRVAVTGLHSGENPAAGCAVIRSLRAEPAFQGPVLGLAYDALEAGIYADGLVQDVVLLSYPSQGLEALKARLIRADETSKIDVLIPSLDSELLSYIRLAPFLKERGIHTVLPTEEQVLARAKANLPGLTARCGVRVPRSRAVFDRASAAEGVRGVTFPIVVKGIFCEAHFAYTGLQAAAQFDALAARWGLPVILQEYVAGTEFDLVALGDGRGGMSGCVGMRKQALSEKGKAWSGVTVRDEGLLALGRTVVHGLSWRGPLEIELIKAARDGEWYLLEINPRFPAWVFLATAAGQNLPFAAVRLALGETVDPMTDYATGVRFARYAQDVICDREEFERLSAAGELKREVRRERKI